MVSKDSKDDFELLHVKSNNSKKQPTLTYSIKETYVENDTIRTSKIEWLGISQNTVEDYEEVKVGVDETKTTACQEWIADTLTSKGILCSELDSLAGEKGYGTRMVKEAKDKLKADGCIRYSKIGTNWFMFPTSKGIKRPN